MDFICWKLSIFQLRGNILLIFRHVIIFLFDRPIFSVPTSTSTPIYHNPFWMMHYYFSITFRRAKWKSSIFAFYWRYWMKKQYTYQSLFEISDEINVQMEMSRDIKCTDIIKALQMYVGLWSWRRRFFNSRPFKQTYRSQQHRLEWQDRLMNKNEHGATKVSWVVSPAINSLARPWLPSKWLFDSKDYKDIFLDNVNELQDCWG